MIKASQSHGLVEAGQSLEDAMAFMKEYKSLGMTSAQTDAYREHDVRGWAFKDDSGREIGRMDDWMVDDEQGRVRYGIVKIGNRQKLVPVGDLSIDDSSKAVIARGYTTDRFNTMRDYDARSWNQTTEREHYRDFHPGHKGDVLDYETDRFRRSDLPKHIQLLEEHLNLGKRSVKTGEVEIGKRAVSEQVSEDIDLETERLDISRKAVNKPVEGRGALGDKETIKVSLYGEEPVVNKQTFVREEIEINKVKDRRTEHITDQVSHEELVTNNLETKREATFASAEPTEADLLNRKRYEEKRKTKERVDVTPIDDQSQIDRPI
jgi:uncharacterized protein (TIGR02271 family)